MQNPLESLARFTIYTIYPSQTTTTSGTVRKPTLDHLLTLLRATETFFHPSNHGKWTYKLCRFLQNLSLFFLERWRLEHGSNGDSKTPPANRLTADIRLSFVEAIKPLLFMALFGKDPLAVLAIQGALKNCAWLVPEAIFPGLLDRIYPSLESLTEVWTPFCFVSVTKWNVKQSHRTTACIGALFTTSRPLLTRSHYPPGGQNLLPLLTLLLPGIDMNDPQKASASLMFVSLMSHCVPLIDSSSMTPAAEESEDDLLCRLGTAGFEDWMRAFLGRILTLFENLPDQHGSANSGQQNSETSLMDMVTVWRIVHCLRNSVNDIVIVLLWGPFQSS